MNRGQGLANSGCSILVSINAMHASTARVHTITYQQVSDSPIWRSHQSREATDTNIKEGDSTASK
jgi:hypothetical protein